MIKVNNDLETVLPLVVLHLPHLSMSDCNLEILVFEEKVPGEKPLGAKERTNNKLYPHTLT